MSSQQPYQVTSLNLTHAPRRFEVAGATHVIITTGVVHEPYAEFWFENGEWHFLRVLHTLPDRGLELGVEVAK